MTKEEFRTCRDKLGLTQQEMAEELGFKSSMAISLIERGERRITPTVEKLIGIILNKKKKKS